MHHKYVVRDCAHVWTGSTNWTLDSWEREENVIASVDAPALAARLRGATSTSCGATAEVERSGDVGHAAAGRAGDGAARGSARAAAATLSHRIAEAIGRARGRVRIASPVITAGPILGDAGRGRRRRPPRPRRGRRRDADRPGLPPVEAQRQRGLEDAAARSACWRGRFTGKRLDPWSAGHASTTSCTRRSRSPTTRSSSARSTSPTPGEMNAENVLEIADAALADRLARTSTSGATRYPAGEALSGRARRQTARRPRPGRR